MSNLRADNFGNRAGTSSITADTLLQGTAKAWASLNGTGTIALQDSFNIGSVVDNAAGDYSYNFSTAFPSINYNSQLSIGNTVAAVSIGYWISANTASAFRHVVVDNTYGAVDRAYVQTTHFGDPT